jgi:hypothetical protein
MKAIASLGVILVSGIVALACSADPGSTTGFDGGAGLPGVGSDNTGGPGVGGAGAGTAANGSGARRNSGGVGSASAAGGAPGFGGAASSNGGAIDANGGAINAYGGAINAYGGATVSAGGAFTAHGGAVNANGGTPSTSGNGGAFIGGVSNGGVTTGNGGRVPANGGRPPGNGGSISTGGSPICTPRASSCSGNRLQTCNADGSAYASSILCPEGCDPDTGTCRLCTPGGFCDGNTSVTCDASGQSLARNTCPKLCVGAGVCSECRPESVETDCPNTDPCQVPSCNTTTNRCEFREANVNDSCSMLAGYGDCTAGGCLGFCTDRGSCDPVVVIKANVNGKYVTLTADGYLLASADSKTNAARFALHVDPRARAYEMAFYSLDAGTYVGVDAATIPIETGARAIAQPEVFINFDGTGDYDPTGELVNVTMTFWSAQVSKYLTAEDAGASPLIANRDAIGPWEQFTLELASP